MVPAYVTGATIPEIHQLTSLLHLTVMDKHHHRLSIDNMVRYMNSFRHLPVEMSLRTLIAVALATSPFLVAALPRPQEETQAYAGHTVESYVMSDSEGPVAAWPAQNPACYPIDGPQGPGGNPCTRALAIPTDSTEAPSSTALMTTPTSTAMTTEVATETPAMTSAAASETSINPLPAPSSEAAATSAEAAATSAEAAATSAEAAATSAAAAATTEPAAAATTEPAAAATTEPAAAATTEPAAAATTEPAAAATALI
ncbi:MAG: hypothetical protein Q9169_002295 [Polycauliona sp. 2 TL-2023]